MGKRITGCAAVFRIIYGAAAGLCLALLIGFSLFRASQAWRILSIAEEITALAQFCMIMLGASFLVWRSGPYGRNKITRGQIFRKIFLQIIFFGAAVFLIATSVKMIGLSQHYVSIALKLPRAVNYIVVVLGSIGVIIQSAANLVLLFQKGGNPDARV